MEELHFREKINWPDGYRMAVVLTFDFQGGEDVKPDKNGKINHEEWTQGEYGPQTGIWRILRILDETGVKGTFLTCGAIAERYPEAIRAIAQRGHEIAGHGYHHEVARDLTCDEEREVMRKRFGLDGQPAQTLEEVGRDLGITRERVRQIQARSIRKIQLAVRSAQRVRRGDLKPGRGARLTSPLKR